jgi:hypothetical protein
MIEQIFYNIELIKPNLYQKIDLNLFRSPNFE